MAVLVSVQSIAKAYGERPLFENLSFAVAEGDRLGLVGPNGSGKSTLLRILAGQETPDAGVVAVRKQTRVGFVAQQASFPARPIGEIVLGALAGEPLDDDVKHQRVALTLSRLGFDDEAQLATTLSGGYGKRLQIACELVREPDLLLLDEPTNHLDLDTILWLERFLAAEPTAFVVVSHDRAFLEATANRVLELNRCYAQGFLDSRGRYSDFLARKEEALAAQSQLEEVLANRVRRELEWLRRGPKARTTKAQGRIDQAERLIGELASVKQRNRAATAQIDFDASERATKRLLVARGVGKSFAGRTVIEGLDLVLSPGRRVGLLGANGSGKTTLLRLLAGELPPDAGEIERAPDLRTVYFAQERALPDPRATLRRALAPHGDQVVYRDRALHVATWAKRFLFRAEQLEMAVERLSGGERARLAIARLMLQPADLLILDEPTNDLDIPTLEALEESLLEFPGALVLVTHDRFLLDRVSTEILALDGRGGAVRFADVAQWQSAQRAAEPAARPRAAAKTAPRADGSAGAETRAPGAARGATGDGAGAARGTAPARRRLSYNEKRELEQMEERILGAEEALLACKRATEDPGIFSQPDVVKQRFAALQAAQDEVDRLYARWQELEAGDAR